MNRAGETTVFDRLALLAYLVLSWALLLPFSARIGSVLPGPRVDTWQNLWNYWWVRRAFLTGHTPFESPMLFHPYGADLSFHTLSLLNTAFAVPLGGILSPVTLLGLSLFLAFPIGAWGAYLLAKEVTGSAPGAFVAGIVYAFFPHHVDQIYSHLNLTSNQFLPFLLLFLVRFHRHGTWKNAIAAALFLALQSYGCMTYMMHGIFLAATVILAGVVRPPRGTGRAGWYAKTAGALVVFLLLTAPLLIPPLKGSFERGGFKYKRVRPALSASVETLLSPSVFHPLVGERVRNGNRAYDHLPRGGTAYLGFGMLVLAITGFVSRRRELWPYAAGGAACIILALGPALQIRIGEETGLPLPYMFFRQIPILRFLRVPNRFLVPASLLFAPLVAAGIAALLGGRKRRIVAVLLALLMMVEYLPAPVPVSAITPPPFTAMLAKRAGDGVVLDVPLFLGSQATIYMYYQTIHDRPIITGYVSIPPPGQGKILDEDPFFEWLADTGNAGGFRKAPEDDPLPELRRLGIGDVVLHKDFDSSFNRYAPPGMDWPKESDGGRWYWKYTTVTGSVPAARMKAFREELEKWLGAPYYEDERIALFAVDGRVSP